MKELHNVPLFAVQPNQASINDYAPGVGIGWHPDIDDPGDTITSVSLMGDTTVDFWKGSGPVVSVRILRLSAVQNTGELREMESPHSLPHEHFGQWSQDSKERTGCDHSMGRATSAGHCAHPRDPRESRVRLRNC